ncbi:TetR/AcrR family transcriptional regulator [Alteribacter keqinensis]|uniref:TetR/AcrR family transcriptional regulator n=1 Tax=Alteribacter keqinensis TaxID=2483800 RepID=A0A3M7TN80_9BACI|nr:TetR/AcrR family transcriptional regulator [Alteribacter keqinensis]RNA66576.1 TetR/AcrR family transcriptional regulator [Alteribacter keqinensis]
MGRGDHSQTQNRIVSTAHALFMEHGYRSVSTRRIADACGLTQPALYHHFSSKEAIYLEVLRTDLNRTKASLNRIAVLYDDVAECLFQMTYYILVNSPENMGQMVRDIRTEMSAAFREKINEWWHEAYRLPITAVFEKGIRNGVIRDPGQFDASAEKYVCLLVNMISQAIPSGGESDGQDSEAVAEKRAHFIIDVLLNGLNK